MLSWVRSRSEVWTWDCDMPAIIDEISSQLLFFVLLLHTSYSIFTLKILSISKYIFLLNPILNI